MALDWIRSFLYSQLFVTLPKPEKDFTGQTIIVTGSNTGLGKEAVRHLSALNAALIIIAVRTTSKGLAARNDILKTTHRDPSTVEVWELDLQSHDSIKAFVARASTLPRLDAILENAGIMTKYFKLVAGHETTIAVNVVGTFLLALLILPKLKETAEKFGVQTRISVVASDLHYMAKFPERESVDVFDALDVEADAAMGMERYAVSKLLQVLAVREMGSLLSQDVRKSPPVLVNCMTPGACKSDFDRESTGLARTIGNLLSALIARTTEEGSRTLVTGLEAGDESQGGYMADCHLARPSPFVLSAEGQKVQKKVWTELSKGLEAIQPGIMQNI